MLKQGGRCRRRVVRPIKPLSAASGAIFDRRTPAQVLPITLIKGESRARMSTVTAVRGVARRVAVPVPIVCVAPTGPAD
jgi:hypothetical protein